MHILQFITSHFCSVLQAIESAVSSAIDTIQFSSTVLGYVLNVDLAALDIFGCSQDRRPVLESGKRHSLALAEGDQVCNSQSHILVQFTESNWKKEERTYPFRPSQTGGRSQRQHTGQRYRLPHTAG